MRKLKLLAALLALLALIASVSVSPAMADHWFFYEDSEGQCGWDWLFVYPYWEYGCHAEEEEPTSGFVQYSS